MKIYLIWAQVPTEPECVELVGAWDQYTRDENPEGFEHDLQDARTLHGGENVRVQIANLAHSQVLELFTAPEVELT